MFIAANAIVGAHHCQRYSHRPRHCQHRHCHCSSPSSSSPSPSPSSLPRGLRPPLSPPASLRPLHPSLIASVLVFVPASATTLPVCASTLRICGLTRQQRSHLLLGTALKGEGEQGPGRYSSRENGKLSSPLRIMSAAVMLNEHHGSHPPMNVRL